MTKLSSPLTAGFPLPGEIISYLDMCRYWGNSFQRGMHFHLKDRLSVILMSRRRDAPYRDRIEEEGRILIYEGHDIPRRLAGPSPKKSDQPRENPGGTLTQNGLFEKAARVAKQQSSTRELVAVYEKIHRGIWSFNGWFRLTDCWLERDGNRNVFKFRLELFNESVDLEGTRIKEPEQTRLIPSAVKLAVWKRDKGSCVLCGAKNNLHFDHEIPYSKGGTSLVEENIRLLCARHNIAKRDKIE